MSGITGWNSGITIASATSTVTHFLLGSARISDPLHDDAAEQAGGLQGKHENDNDQRDSELLAVADDVDAGQLLDLVAGIGDHVLEHADDEPAGDSSSGIADAAN